MSNLDDQIKIWQNEQDLLKQQISFNDSFQLEEIKYIGGVDISFEKKDPNNACVFIVIIEMPKSEYHDMKIVYEDHKIIRLNVPYISGFLAFREVSHYKDLIETMKQKAPQFFPQIILVDGFGTLHHRGFGSASHLGVICDVCTIGCAKTLINMDGLFEKDIKQKFKNDHNLKELDLVGSSGKIHGKALLTGNSNPIYISTGHKISLETAAKVVKKISKYRIPEPIRQADIRSKLYF
ncbi:MAG: endonuclease V [Terrestrivirus sp.]|uniref:Endonuclease V n=1 Tax=Terrestrivirus sp. TaxID=2487775 RepID=A0A3G4ZP72_9VIRU|nr:MAG: endonuclease V [Terrestrivirus sp.]